MFQVEFFSEQQQSTSALLATFVRTTLTKIVSKDALYNYSWTGVSRENRHGKVVARESFRGLSSVVKLIRGETNLSNKRRACY